MFIPMSLFSVEIIVRGDLLFVRVWKGGELMKRMNVFFYHDKGTAVIYCRALNGV